MRKWLTDNRFPLVCFLIWRIGLFAVAFLATILIPKWGGWFPYADRVLAIGGLPSWMWGFGNFDGVHYLKIAQNGYSAMFSQVFFPLYPFLIRFLNIFPKNVGLDTVLYVDPTFLYTGLLLSNLLFVFAMGVYSKIHTRTDLLFLLLLPGAFYFGAVYTESLFLLLALLVFYFWKQKKYLLTAILAVLLSLTRITGVVMVVYFAISFWEERQKLTPKKLLAVISPLVGLGFYMFYLWRMTGNPIYFLTAQPSFGANRSALPIIFLPQVFYRYAKMLVSLPVWSLSFFTVVNELTVTFMVIGGLILAFRKMKLSFWLYCLGVFLLPTLTGTLSSMPRYVLACFPLLPMCLRILSRKQKLALGIFFAVWQTVLIILFTRGYWVA